MLCEDGNALSFWLLRKAPVVPMMEIALLKAYAALAGDILATSRALAHD